MTRDLITDVLGLTAVGLTTTVVLWLPAFFGV